MDNKSYFQLIIIQATSEANRQDYDDKMKNLTEYLTAMITLTMDQIKFSKSSLDQNNSPKAHYNTTMVSANNRAP